MDRRDHPGSSLDCFLEGPAFDRHGNLYEPLHRVQLPGKVARMTNMAYGGADRRTLYITESYSGSILAAKMPMPGKILYSHL